nr:uncharacterized protein CI109_001795 [Kwoniella shandongensis]KAA5529855.1 hypothetical protein CI109_001795 [Kwoniella shandongensis]
MEPIIDYETVPQPRSAEQITPSRASSLSTQSTHHRRPSLTLSPGTLPNIGTPHSNPVPVPARHGSLSSRSPRVGPATLDSLSTSPSFRRHSKGTGSFSSGSMTGSLFLNPTFLPSPVSVRRSRSITNERPRPEIDIDDGRWLGTLARQILAMDQYAEAKVVAGDMRVEQAAKILLDSGEDCLLVTGEGDGHSAAFFDYADLNTFVLLVLEASTSPQDDATPSNKVTSKRLEDAVQRLRSGEGISVGAMCNISGKNPYHEVTADAPVSSFLRLFGSGVHRIAVTGFDSPCILTHATLLHHLLSLPSDRVPAAFMLQVTAGSLGLPLRPLISLPGTASVLDAMQVMSVHGRRALGVLAGQSSHSRRFRRSSSSGSDVPSPQATSPMLSPVDAPDELVSIVRSRECAALVIPSEGKQVLAMSLEEMVKNLQVREEGGRDRGEERMPVHTVPPSTTLLHACHLILATSSSRVFIRSPAAISPPISPSTSASSTSISELYLGSQTSGLPAPVQTQLSPHGVLSIVDVFACLVRLYAPKLGNEPSISEIPPAWDVEPVQKRETSEPWWAGNFVT